MERTKNIIRRNLPINDNYELIDSYSTGGIEFAICCANCSRPIVNIAVIKNKEGNIFEIGMDCAETLTNLSFLSDASLNFQEMKSLTAKVNKAKKEGMEIKFKIATDGNFCAVAYWSNYYSIIFDVTLDFAKKYFKSYLKEVSNPEKIGYTKKEFDFSLGFNRFMPSENKNFKHAIFVDGFECIVSVRPYNHLVTGEISGYDFYLEIPKMEYSERITMYSGIEKAIKNQLNKYYFRLFDNSK